MKVLIIHSKVPIYGGAEKAIVRLCEYMSDNAIPHAVAMPSPPDGMSEDLIKNGTPVINNLPSLMANINNYDIINFHNFPATLHAIYCNRPMVWMCNEPPELFTNWKRKFVEWGNRNLVKNRIEHVIVNDRANARRFFDIYGVVPSVILPGVDYEFFSQPVGEPDPKYFTVLQVGTISRYKNQMATVEAVSKLSKKILNIRLWLNGYVTEPDYKTEIEKYLDGIDITRYSNTTREQLRELYSKADVLLHPVKSQGGWLVPFEAISAGTPVIASKDLTCSDIMIQNNLASVCDDYATGLYQCFQNYEAYKAVTLKAREWVSKNLTWDKHSEATIKEFERILSQ